VCVCVCVYVCVHVCVCVCVCVYSSPEAWRSLESKAEEALEALPAAANLDNWDLAAIDLQIAALTGSTAYISRLIIIYCSLRPVA
jgi:hypothetical protein